MTRRRLLLASVLVLVLAGVAWPAYAAHVAHGVRMSWGPDPLCTRGAIREQPDPTYDGDPSAAPRVPVVRVQPGTRCTAELLVVNDSGRTVHLRGLHVFGLGPGFGSPIKSAMRARDDDQWVVYPLDRELAGHEIARVRFSFEYVDRGCSDAAGIAGLPLDIRYSALGIPHRAGADHELFYSLVRAVKANCPRPDGRTARAAVPAAPRAG